MKETNIDNLESKKLPFPTEEQLHNWVNERTLLPENSSAFAKLKEEFTPIGAEKNARASIARALVLDGLAIELKTLPYGLSSGDFGIDPDENFFLLGGAMVKANARPAVKGIEILMESKGFENGIGEITIQGADTLTSETVLTTVGVRVEKDGFKTYFGEEKNAEGKVISRAEIHIGEKMTDRLSEKGLDYDYRLELHPRGERYFSNNAEFDIDSDISPRATAVALKLLTGAVVKGLKE
jgi:hypothetical protein